MIKYEQNLNPLKKFNDVKNYICHSISLYMKSGLFSVSVTNVILAILFRITLQEYFIEKRNSLYSLVVNLSEILHQDMPSKSLKIN